MSARLVSSTMLILVMLCGCTQKRVEQEPERGDVPWQRSEHWVHSESLRVVMDKLIEQPPPDLDHAGTDARREQSLRDAAAFARALSDAAILIPRVVADVDMAEADRAGFNAQVAALRDQAKALEEAARGSDMDAMRRIVREIDATCVSCHTRFRDYSGLLETPRKASIGSSRMHGEQDLRAVLLARAQ